MKALAFSRDIYLYDFPSDSAVFVHRENITHLKAAIALAEPLLGL